jgi:hypothetical protein
MLGSQLGNDSGCELGCELVLLTGWLSGLALCYKLFGIAPFFDIGINIVLVLNNKGKYIMLEFLGWFVTGRTSIILCCE